MERACTSERNKVSLSNSSRKRPMKDFDKGVLHRLAGRDVVPLDLVVVGPPQDGVRGQLGAVVADDRLGFAARDQKAIEFAGDPDAGDRGVGRPVPGIRACSRRPRPGCASVGRR